MLLTLFGIITLFNDEHPANAYAPMLFTLSGIVTLFNDEHPANAYAPILSISFPKDILCIS